MTHNGATHMAGWDGSAPQVSIVVAAYNNADSIAPCLESALAQSLPNIEVIVVDDASTDETPGIARQMIAADNRVRLIEQAENEGAALARKAGVMAAVGSYILFLDGDDRLFPGACERLVALMEEQPVDILGFRPRLVAYDKRTGKFVDDPTLDNGLFCGELHGEEIARACFLEQRLTWVNWGKLFSRALCQRAFEKIDARGVHRANDLYCMFFLAYYASTFRGVDEGPYYEYRFGAGQDSRAPIDLDRFRRLNSSKIGIDAIRRFLVENNASPAYFDMLDHARDMLIFNLADTLSRRLPDTLKGAGSRIMADAWSADVVLEALAPRDGQPQPPSFLETSAFIALDQASVPPRQASDAIASVARQYGGLFRHDSALQKECDWLDRRNSLLATDNHKLASRMAGQQASFARKSAAKDARPDITVVMPCYNTSPWLDEAVESVLMQSLGNIELICIDDGSTDGTLEILKEHARRDQRIKVLEQPHSGGFATRNVGLGEAKGRYLFFMDSDDKLAPDMAATTVLLADAMSLDILCFNADTFYDSSELKKRFHSFNKSYLRDIGCTEPCSGKQLMKAMSRQGCYRVPVWLHLANAGFLQSSGVRFIEGLYHEDNPYTFEVMLAAGRAFHIAKPLYSRRIREGSIMTTITPEEDQAAYRQCYSAMFETAVRYGINPKDDPEVIKIIGDLYAGVLRAALPHIKKA